VKALLFVLIVFASDVLAQTDTMLVDFHGTGWGPEQLIDSLKFGKSRRILVPGSLFYPPVDCDKRCRGYYAKATALLKERLPKINVLYIENPTVQTGGDGKTLNYNPDSVLISKIDFSKMISLKELNLIGNDADDIIQMPASFYSSTATKINCYCLNFYERLKETVNAKKPGITIEAGDCNEVMTYLDARF
jgi:hypothetical protein